MASTRLRAVVAVVLALLAVQLAFENLLVFLGASGATLPGLPQSPLVMVAVPLAISLGLLAVLVGGAILSAETLR